MKMKKYQDKILSCIPDKWADFYRKAPNRFKQDFLDSQGVTRDEFIEFVDITNPSGKVCGLFDYLDYFCNPEDWINKNGHIHSALESWLLTEKEMELYNSMPEKFTQAEFRARRIELGLTVKSQSKFHRGSIFKKVPAPLDSFSGKKYFGAVGYYSMEKTIIKPVLK